MELRTQEITHTPPPRVTVRTAKKVAREVNAKTGTTTAKKKALTGGKNRSAKQKVAVKGARSAKVVFASRKPKTTEDNRSETIAIEEQPTLISPDASVEPSLPVVCEALPEPLECAAPEQVVASADVTAPEEIFAPEVFTVKPVQSEPDFAIASEPPSQEWFEAPTPETPEFPVVNSVASESEAFVMEQLAEPTNKSPFAPFLAFWKSLASFVIQKWSWAQEKFKSHHVRKRLRVCETVSLGEKRFVAVIQVDGEQFLVGGSSSSVSTLAHLEPAREFSEVFQRHCGQDLSRA
jgi:hypothetical protein